MKRLLIIFFISALDLASGESNKLAFDIQEIEGATIYNLQTGEGDFARTIWSRRVSLINGKKPYDWCVLIGWDRNERGLMALIEYNEFIGKVLQFNSNDEFVAELEVGGSWLQDIRRGGSVKLEPLDKIEVTKSDGSVARFYISNGKLTNEVGEILERPKPLRVSSQDSERAFKASPQNIAPSMPHASLEKSAREAMPTGSNLNEDLPSPTPWSIIVVVIVAATGLLWLLMKNRK